jgi:hypothetical protein
MKVEIALKEAWMILDSFWNNYGSGVPDPRKYDISDYTRDKAEIQNLKEVWDARYAWRLKWAKRVRRMERKERKCFGCYSKCRAHCCEQADCEEIETIIKNKGRR